MNFAEKEQLVVELRSALTGASSIVLTDFTGLDVETVNGLRSEFRKRGVKCQMAKNTLVRRAITDTEVEAMLPLLVGPTALIWHEEEPAVGAKILKDAIKDNPKFSFKGGYIDGEVFEGEKAKVLADMLGKDELRSQLLGLVKMVPGKFLALLNTPARKFLAVLKAREADLEENQ